MIERSAVSVSVVEADFFDEVLPSFIEDFFGNCCPALVVKNRDDRNRNIKFLDHK